MSEQLPFVAPSGSETQPHRDDAAAEFRCQAEAAQPGFIREFWGFLRVNKKWWLLPIVTVLLLFSLLIMMAGTAAAPFIYTLF